MNDNIDYILTKDNLINNGNNNNEEQEENEVKKEKKGLSKFPKFKLLFKLYLEQQLLVEVFPFI